MPPAAAPAEGSRLGLAVISTVFTLVVGVVTAFFFLNLWQRDRDRRKEDKEQEEDEEEEEEEGERETQEIAPEDMPPDGVFTIETLTPFNGVDKPICMGVCGKVLNVSSSANIQPGVGYGKLWAGKEATYSLATVSLKPEDANRLDYKVSEFTEDQHKALAGWYKHFTTKYPVIGTLKEYDGWDFSSVFKEAESQTPFASADKNSGSAAGTTKPAEQAEAPAGSRTFSKGDRVRVENVEEDQSEFRGAEGVLVDFNATEGCFVVKLDDDLGQGQTLFKPSSLEIISS